MTASAAGVLTDFGTSTVTGVSAPEAARLLAAARAAAVACRWAALAAVKGSFAAADAAALAGFTGTPAGALAADSDNGDGDADAASSEGRLAASGTAPNETTAVSPGPRPSAADAADAADSGAEAAPATAFDWLLVGMIFKAMIAMATAANPTMAHTSRFAFFTATGALPATEFGRLAGADAALARGSGDVLFIGDGSEAAELFASFTGITPNNFNLRRARSA